MGPVVVYNPADEPLPFVFAAADRELPANAFVVLDAGHLLQPWKFPEGYVVRVGLAPLLPREDAEALLKLLLDRFGKVGVVHVTDFSDSGLAQAVLDAERAHAAFLRESLTPVLLENAKARETAKAAGLAHVDSPEAVRATLLAKEWQLLG